MLGASFGRHPPPCHSDPQDKPSNGDVLVGGPSKTGLCGGFNGSIACSSLVSIRRLQERTLGVTLRSRSSPSSQSEPQLDRWSREWGRCGPAQVLLGL